MAMSEFFFFNLNLGQRELSDQNVWVAFPRGKPAATVVLPNLKFYASVCSIVYDHTDRKASFLLLQMWVCHTHGGVGVGEGVCVWSTNMSAQALPPRDRKTVPHSAPTVAINGSNPGSSDLKPDALITIHRAAIQQIFKDVAYVCQASSKPVVNQSPDIDGPILLLTVKLSLLFSKVS